MGMREILEKRGLYYKAFETKPDQGNPTIVSVEFLVSLCENSDEETREMMEKNVQTLDETDGDIMAYLEHVGRNIIEPLQ